jgi:catalase (peroxidase I)
MVGAGLLAGAISGSNAYTWPDERIDYIDALVYQGQGFNGLGFGQDIRNCESRDIVEADWLRLAFHDAATHDTRTGLGGIDGSIGFETNRPENPGVSLQQSLESFIQHMTSSVSMADLIALGATMSVNACNIKSGLDTKNHSLPFRYGRIDATGPGPEGVPTPDETIGSFRDKFQYMGFNSSEMIALVACGHTLGGVHDLDFTDMISTFNMGRVCSISKISRHVTYDN